MEEQNLGEQPDIKEEPNQSKEAGSPFGKFSDAQTLKQAYDNLEKEFTRKSQLLSNFQKQANDDNQFSEIQESTDTKDIRTDKIPELQVKEVDSAQYWEREDWSKQVQDFLEENPTAKQYAKEISKMIIEDKALLKSNRPLYTAWAKWLQNNYKTPEQLLKDEQFLIQVQNNDKVRRGIIKDYLTGINNRQSTPPLFAVSDGGGVGSGKKQTPQTLDEVREVVKKIFSK